jgi:hypothetical protein
MLDSTSHAAFINAVQRMEKRTARVTAFIIMHGAEYSGRVVISYPQDGAGRLYAIAWLPGQNSTPTIRHHGSAGGYGYDKATAAMGGAGYYHQVAKEWRALDDGGYDWRAQLIQAGYQVIQAV